MIKNTCTNRQLQNEAPLVLTHVHSSLGNKDVTFELTANRFKIPVTVIYDYRLEHYSNIQGVKYSYL